VIASTTDTIINSCISHETSRVSWVTSMDELSEEVNIHPNIIFPPRINNRFHLSLRMLKLVYLGRESQ